MRKNRIQEAEDHILVTETDYERLRRLIDAWTGTRDTDVADALAEELDRAEVVPADRIANHVVTMSSRVVFTDEKTGEVREIVLVYPSESDPKNGKVSVLAPIGSALLGLSVGQMIDWPLPGGRSKRLRVTEIVYQPERDGHPHL